MNWKPFIAAVLLIGVAVFALRFNNFYFAENAFIREANPEQIMEHARNLNSPLVLVNFWASWCEPCKIELPHILKLQKAFAAQGLKVIFVSVDEPDDLPSAEKFLKENHVDFQTFYKGHQSLKFVSKFFPNWSGAVPATVLLGKDGQIVEAWEGETSYEEFEAKIKPHLKGS